MPVPKRILNALFLAPLFFGCGDDVAGSQLPDREFTDLQRSMCPESPFKPEYPMAPKTAAAYRMVHFRIEIYTSRGKFVDLLEGDFDPVSAQPGRGGSPAYPVWDGRDAAGKEAPSGYYFMVVTLSDPASSYRQTQTECIFRINPDDEGKVR